MFRVRHAVVHLCWLAVLLALCPSATGQAPKGLHYQFKKGDQFAFTVATTQIMKMANGEDVSFVNLLSNVDVTWQVQDVDKNGKAKIAGMLKRVRMEVNSGDDPTLNMVVVDSTDQNFKENEQFKIFGPLLNKGLTWLMDRQGIISELKMPDEVLKVIKDEPKLADMPPETWSREMFHTLFHPTALVFPSDAVGKDKSWKNSGRETSFEGLFKLTQQSEFKQEGTEKRGGRQVDHIAIKPIISLEVGEQGKQAGLKLTGDEGKGKVFVDSATGMIIEAQLTFSMIIQSTEDPTVSVHVRQITTMKPTEKVK